MHRSPYAHSRRTLARSLHRGRNQLWVFWLLESIGVGSHSVAPVPLSPRVLRGLRNIIARSVFNFSCGLCVDLRASVRCDWLSGCPVEPSSEWLGLDWTPVATLATDETAQAVALTSTRHEMMAGDGMPVVAMAIVETASCPSRIPVATLATDETAQAVALPSTRHEMKVGGMPVAAVFIPAIVETPSCPSRIPVATLAADESALCLSTRRSAAHGCGLAVRGKVME